ncbi:hypothetical protein [Kitasatospora sp. NPDC101183]|uniref:hypothetical protein n=1 Tax=Kitasatospora sp. NPDC101183 TaxID=3364100 RepID=UPI0038229285
MGQSARLGTALLLLTSGFLLCPAPAQAVPERIPANSCTDADAEVGTIYDALPPGTSTATRRVYLLCGADNYGLKHIDTRHGPGSKVDIKSKQVTRCVRAIAEHYRPQLEDSQWVYQTTGTTRWRLVIDPVHANRGVITVYAMDNTVANDTRGAYRDFALCPAEVAV